MEWKHITLGKFIQLQEILKSDDEDLTKKIDIYALLTDSPLEEIREIPLGIFLKAYSTELKFMETEIPQVIPKYWEHNKVQYNITTQIEKLKAGQYIDYKHHSKTPNQFHNIMAVLCYDGDKYDGETHKQRAELFYNNMPVTIAFPLAVFFLELWNAWSAISLEYSANQIMEMQADFQKTTVG